MYNDRYQDAAKFDELLSDTSPTNLPSSTLQTPATTPGFVLKTCTIRSEGTTACRVSWSMCQDGCLKAHT